jgi:glycosyltransferase involved in cell wall biosynthesis
VVETTVTLLPITVVIPVKNEEANLDLCLQRLARFSAVTVIDSSSTDQTLEIARAHGAQVLNFEWDGRYPKKRNWFLINHAPSTPWVLFIDADEFVDDAFCNEVSIAIAENCYNAFWLNYTNYFLGRPLKFGIRQRKLALFRSDQALYEQVDEEFWSNLDMEVHEHPVVEGPIGEIKAPIEHNDFRGIDKFIDRHRGYAGWEARRALSLNKKAGTKKNLTRRQRFKYRYIRKCWYPFLYFFYTYFVRLGILDGAVGFQYAFYKAWYFLTIRLLIRELTTVDGTRRDRPYVGD